LIVEAACWAHYLESDFIWSRRPRRQLSPMTSRRQTLDNSGFRIEVDGRCRSRCIRCRVLRRTSGTVNGGQPDWLAARCTRLAAVRSLVTAVIHG
jgi:hypothetical protein